MVEKGKKILCWCFWVKKGIEKENFFFWFGLLKMNEEVGRVGSVGEGRRRLERVGRL